MAPNGNLDTGKEPLRGGIPNIPSILVFILKRWQDPFEDTDSFIVLEIEWISNAVNFSSGCCLRTMTPRSGLRWNYTRDPSTHKPQLLLSHNKNWQAHHKNWHDTMSVSCVTCVNYASPNIYYRPGLFGYQFREDNKTNLDASAACTKW